MDNRTNQKISDFIAHIASNNKNLLKAYLFGSYSKGTDGIDSDIDIALIIDKLAESDRFDFQVQLMMIASDFDIRIEPHPISEHEFTYGNPFAAEIMKYNIEIEPNKPYQWYS